MANLELQVSALKSQAHGSAFDGKERLESRIKTMEEERQRLELEIDNYRLNSSKLKNELKSFSEGYSQLKEKYERLA